jgi:hypothetical protein
MATAPAAPVTAVDLYNLIKSYEDQFPLPAPYVTVNVGTFDVTTGTFSGLTSRTTTDPEPIQHEPNQKPTGKAYYQGATYVTIDVSAQWKSTTTITPAPQVPLAPVLLQFVISNFAAAWSVTVDGRTTSVPAGQTSVSVSIWDAQAANWSIQAGGKTHSDRLMIQRPAGTMGVGAGAFTIPVLPITIVYAPPKDSLVKSSASYTQGTTIGTTITTTFGTDNSQTNPNMQTSYATAQQFSDALTVAGQIVGLEGQAGATASKALGDIGGVLGKFTSSTTTELSQTTDNSMTFTESLTQGLVTVPQEGGPGAGDVIQFARNVLMAWVGTGNQVVLWPFSFDVVDSSATGLQNNFSQLQITQADAQFLLSFDPFVAGGPFAAVDLNRFQLQQTLTYAFGVEVPVNNTVTRGSSTTVTDKSVTTQTNEWDAGPLFQMFGLGGKTTTSLTTGSATGNSVSNTVTITGTLFAGPQDDFAVNIYYDTAFGTFAFQQEQPAATPVLTGSGGTPGELVTLSAGGRTFRTVTDSSSKFSFRSPSIPAGPATLTIGKQAPTSVNVAAHS